MSAEGAADLCDKSVYRSGSAGCRYPLTRSPWVFVVANAGFEGSLGRQIKKRQISVIAVLEMRKTERVRDNEGAY
jgi:hypothetical protein